MLFLLSWLGKFALMFLRCSLVWLVRSMCCILNLFKKSVCDWVLWSFHLSKTLAKGCISTISVFPLEYLFFFFPDRISLNCKSFCHLGRLEISKTVNSYFTLVKQLFLYFISLHSYFIIRMKQTICLMLYLETISAIFPMSSFTSSGFHLTARNDCTVTATIEKGFPFFPS